MLFTSVALFGLLSSANALVARGKVSGCDLTGAKMTLPAGQTHLVQPNESPSYLTLGVGTQNYTCSAAGNYTYVYDSFTETDSHTNFTC
jgi:hypothetical protein